MYNNECAMLAAKCEEKKGKTPEEPVKNLKNIFDKSSSEEDDADASCSFGCLAVMRPVTDPETGKTYSNDCMMRAAKCREKKGEEEPVEKYKGILDESSEQDSGDDSNNDEGESDSGKESTDGTPKSYCPNVSCPAVYQPVTDENGKTYPNKCSMEAAKCTGPRENVLDEYKRLYGKEFGAPREGNSGEESASDEDDDTSQKTKMVKSTGKESKSSKSTKTSSANGSGIGSIYEDGSEGVIDDGSSTPSKKCADVCPDVVMPVCGSDGVKYSNPCELKIAACKNPDQNIVEDDSACSKTSRDDTLLKMSPGKIGTMDM
ncbi:Epi6-like protease inhibitor [Phytophthora megakarya]|uniref:Epi6-like protease inhibitor n=1 Tax=Phytophthora megakarya TaxID=4795 RepID=A0A225X2N7_9STRA|nr:Epi6-like protease inhibitor [Phytophthora megakarya]